MKIRLLALFAAIITVANIGQLRAEQSQTTDQTVWEGTAEDVTAFKNNMGLPADWKGRIIYGNGHKMIVTKSAQATKDNQVTITFEDNAREAITLADTEQAILFGGSKEANISGNTHIVVESGKIGYIFGGGSGTKGKSVETPKTANVGNVTIDVKGGYVGLIFAGGLYRSNVKEISLTVSNAEIAHLYCGGFDQGQTSNLLTTTFEESVNHVEKSTLTMTNSTVYGYVFVGGGQGYSYSKEVQANITGSTLHCGLLGTGSNGRSDKVTINATNCKFEKADKQADIIEIAPLNRGIINDISMTFDNCVFPTNKEDYACQLGATHLYDGKSTVELGKVNVEFKSNCTNTPDILLSDGLTKADATVTGTKVIAGPSAANASTTVKKYTIGEGKTWTFNNGLEMASDVTLTETGTLIVKGTYTAATAQQLEDAIKQTGISAIELSGSEYTLTNPLVLDKAMTLSSVDPSKKATIKGYIAIKAEGATVKDINLSYERKSSLFSDKIGISVFANEATITGNTFTSTTSDGTNGIVFYPVGTTATQKYTVTGNTFSLAGAASTGIIVRENFKSTTQIPNVATTASLSNGSALDQQIIAAGSTNTFSNMPGGYYVRVTGDYSVLDGTGSGAEAITQKYIYSYVNEGNVAEAIALSQMGATVNAKSVASSSLASKMNALATKTALANGIKILCSDMTVYSDLASALAATTADKAASYLKLDNTTYSLVEAKKVTPTIADTDKPTASEIEVGQPLSASFLSGGSANVDENAIAGVFSWKEPNTAATVGSNSYNVLFTPTDQTMYTTATAKVTVKAIQYYTVTAGKCENGKVEITNPKASNKYIKDTTLTVKAIPAKHYQFDTWTEGADSYKITKDASLVATFKAITHKVTFGENITVLNGGAAIATNADVAEGSVLTVTAAKDGNKLTSLTYNGKTVINNQITVDGAIAIKADFEALPPSTRLVKVDYSDADTQNGKVQLFDESGNIIEAGSAVAVGKTVSVVAIPDYGYKVKAEGLSVTGATLIGSKFTVAANEATITVKQQFEKRTFAVTLPIEATDHATVTVTGNESNALAVVPFETVLTISSAKASTGYKLIAVIVNGKQVATSGTFKVTADTKVNAVVEKLPEIMFTDTEQSCTYNGQEQAFVVRTIPAGISNITLSYGELEDNVKPTEAGKYNVYASFNDADKFASLSKKKIGTLEIKKAQWTAVNIPESKNVKESANAASYNEYYWSSTEKNNFREATLKLSEDLSKNYENPKFIIPTTSVDAIDLDIQSDNTPANASLKGRSIVLKSTTKTQTLKGVNGTIAAYNGPVKVENSAYDGQTLTLKAIPNVGYSSIPTWSGSGVTDNQDGTATIVLGQGEITATFKAKEAAPIETGKTVNGTYNGVTYGTSMFNPSSLIKSDLPGWSLDIKQGGLTVEPTHADTYDIVASRQEDEAYAATAITIGTLSIAKATPVLADVKGSDIIAGQTLRESVLSGTSDVQGTFSWKNPDTQMNTANENQKATAIFKSDDSNYTDKEVEATLKVTAKSGNITTRTLTLTVNNPENGNSVVTTLNGTPFTGSISVKEKDVLTVTFKANNDCTAAATINDGSYTSGSNYTIGAAGDVKVVVTFTKNEKPAPDEPGESETPVSGIKLDATSKTLTVGESFVLKATIEPSYADNKKVSWSSSNPAIASVDQDGNVKALKTGTCKITVTTDDGDYTADCEITVSVATGIEELLASNRIYSSYSQIIIEPTASPEVSITDMTGRIMYHNRITEKTQVAVSSGFYLVRLSENGKATTVKVIVK